MKKVTIALLSVSLAGGGLWLARARQTSGSAPLPLPLANGKRITPLGEQVNVGSFPTTLLPSPDGKYVIVSSLGARSQLTVLDAKTGKVVSTLAPKAIGNKKPGLYYGLAFAPPAPDNGGAFLLYAARGSDDVVSTLQLSPEGTLSETESVLKVPKAAGVAAGADYVAVTSSEGDPKNGLKGSMTLFDPQGTAKKVELPGYPLGVAYASGKFYVASEQAGGVDVVDPVLGQVLQRIETGAQSTTLLAAPPAPNNGGASVLFVANAGSDTVSVIDTATDKVTKTILLRPAEARGIPGVTPMGMAVKDNLLYVACADLNAVAVVDVAKGSLTGYLPAGWYPTAVAYMAPPILGEGGAVACWSPMPRV
jgi:YVTN family beta-propeller protein